MWRLEGLIIQVLEKRVLHEFKERNNDYPFTACLSVFGTKKSFCSHKEVTVDEKCIFRDSEKEKIEKNLGDR